MDNAQIWVILGILAATIVSSMTLLASVSFKLTSTLQSTFDSRFDALGETLVARFETVNERFNAVDARFDTVDHKLAALDRDVQVLYNRGFGSGGD